MDAFRIFISSVIKGFEAERAAARSAVELLRFRPIMAEDFGAVPHSPQRACLTGVKNSDALVLLMGRRYGFRSPSGQSPTEEEFHEARAHGLPIFVFVKNGEPEAAQDAFLRRLKDYEGGYHVASFDTPSELKDSVVASLNDHFGPFAARTLDPDSARAELDRRDWGANKPRQYSCWLGMVVLPARQRAQLVPLITLGEKRFQDELLKAALFGTGAVFTSDLGTQRDETATSFILRQQSARNETHSMVEVHSNGTLCLGTVLDNSERAGISPVLSSVIDEDRLHDFLATSLRFANAFFDALADGPMLTTFYVGASLSGIGTKSFGRIPSVAPTSMCMPLHRLPDPLRFPAEPYRLARSGLTAPKCIADELTELVRRAFRLEGAYYEEGNSRTGHVRR